MGKQTAQIRQNPILRTFGRETMLRSDARFVVLKVSDARKGAESRANAWTRGDQRRSDQRASQPQL